MVFFRPWHAADQLQRSPSSSLGATTDLCIDDDDEGDVLAGRRSCSVGSRTSSSSSSSSPRSPPPDEHHRMHPRELPGDEAATTTLDWPALAAAAGVSPFHLPSGQFHHQHQMVGAAYGGQPLLDFGEPGYVWLPANYQHVVHRLNQQDAVAKQMKKFRPKKFKCLECNTAFSNNGQLTGHMRIHTGERPYTCSVEGCNKAFTRNEELTRHKRIHTGIRPHVCEICRKKFGRKDHLKKHFKTHNKGVSYLAAAAAAAHAAAAAAVASPFGAGFPGFGAHPSVAGLPYVYPL